MRYFDGPAPPTAKVHDGDRWRDSDAGVSYRWRAGKGWVRFVDQRAKNKWKPAEEEILRAYYPIEGAEGCAPRLPRRVPGAIESHARKLRLRSPNGPRGLQTAIASEELDEAIRLHRDEKWGFTRIGERFGVSEGAASNAVLMAMARRAGFRPAERDEYGHLTERGADQIREALRKGWKGVDIVSRLAVSASRVSQERRVYSAYLRASRKAPLPPAGRGEEYGGRRHPKDRLKLVEKLFLAGDATSKVSKQTGVSKTQCGRIRNRLIKRLQKKGGCLPGCDKAGKRLTYPNTLLRIPDGTFERLDELLLQRVPVKQAAGLLGLGECSAYRRRDALKARLAAEGKELPPPNRLGSGRAARAGAERAAWLPKGRNNIILYRRNLQECAGDELEARRRTVREIAAKGGGDPGLAEMLDRMRRGEIAVERIAMPARSIDMTLGGVSSGQLV